MFVKPPDRPFGIFLHIQLKAISEDYTDLPAGSPLRKGSSENEGNFTSSKGEDAAISSMCRTCAGSVQVTDENIENIFVLSAF